METNPIAPRPSVQHFAQQMEANLQANDHKDGWDQCNLLWLATKLGEEVGELARILAEVYYNDGTIEWTTLIEYERRIQEECADIGNVAMMIADVTYGSLYGPRGQEEAAE